MYLNTCAKLQLQLGRLKLIPVKFCVRYMPLGFVNHQSKDRVGQSKFQFISRNSIACESAMGFLAQ
jgi:hypothetical protein